MLLGQRHLRRARELPILEVEQLSLNFLCSNALALLGVQAIALELDPLRFLFGAVPLFQFVQRDLLQVLVQLGVRRWFRHLGLDDLWVERLRIRQASRLLYRLEDLILKRSRLFAKGRAQLFDDVWEKVADNSEQRKQRKHGKPQVKNFGSKIPVYATPVLRAYVTSRLCDVSDVTPQSSRAGPRPPPTC